MFKTQDVTKYILFSVYFYLRIIVDKCIDYHLVMCMITFYHSMKYLSQFGNVPHEHTGVRFQSVKTKLPLKIRLYDGSIIGYFRKENLTIFTLKLTNYFV